MPTLPIADKLTLDLVKALIGANTDPAGALTLFAHMTELEARLTAARALKLDNLDAAISTLSTSAQALAILGYVDELESRLTAPRAGYIDTIEARTYNLDARLTAARAASLDGRRYYAGSYTCGAGAWETVLLNNGKGSLERIMVSVPAGASDCRINVEIDGTVVMSTNGLQASNWHLPTYSAGGNLSINPISGNVLPVTLNMEYKTRVYIYVYSGTGGFTTYYGCSIES